MNYQYHDGGRRDAAVTDPRFRGRASADCAVRALAIALSLPYAEVYGNLLALNARRKRVAGMARTHKPTGCYTAALGDFLEQRGKVARITRPRTRAYVKDLPSIPGCLLILSSRHVAAAVDGTIYDTFDSRSRVLEEVWTIGEAT